MNWFVASVGLLLRWMPLRLWRAVPKERRLEIHLTESDFVRESAKRQLNALAFTGDAADVVVDALMRFAQQHAEADDLPLGQAMQEILTCFKNRPFPNPIDGLHALELIERAGFKFLDYQSSYELICAIRDQNVGLSLVDSQDLMVRIQLTVQNMSDVFEDMDDDVRLVLQRNAGVTCGALRLLAHPHVPGKKELALAWLCAYYAERIDVSDGELRVFVDTFGFLQLGKLLPMLRSGHADPDFMEGIMHRQELFTELSGNELKSMVDSKRACAPDVPMVDLMDGERRQSKVTPVH